MPLLLALVACLVSACQDIVTRDEVREGGGKREGDGKQKDAPVYPLTRTLTDSQNRRIETVILGKEGAMLAVERLPGGERFLIPMEKLGPFDQKFFEGLADGGSFRQVKAQVEKEARLAGRADYLRRVEAAAERLRRRGFLLAEDVEAIVERARRLAWPPAVR